MTSFKTLEDSSSKNETTMEASWTKVFAKKVRNWQESLLHTYQGQVIYVQA